MSQPLHIVPPAPFPATRMRRLRQHGWSRRMVAESRLAPADLIQPLFILEGSGRRQAVASMPGIERLSVDLLLPVAERAVELGLPAVALFPVTPAERKSEDARRGLERRQPDVPGGPRAQAPAAPSSASSATWRSTPTPATARTACCATA